MIATFTIALIQNKKLWGLIACHHYQPKHIPYYTRLAANLQGVFLSSQIDVRQVADEFELVKETDKKINELHSVLEIAGTNITKKENLILLKNMLNADSVILYYKEEMFGEGLLPAKEYTLPLLQWFSLNYINGNFNTSMLVSHYPGAAAFTNTVAGLYYLSLDNHSNNCIVWTLREVEKTVNWAGDPNKAVEANQQTNELTPRQSFALWKESVKFQSRVWQKAEINAAATICSAIQHQLHLADLKSEEQRYLNLNEKLQKANEELANMNWISTHDLKEPLRKIQLYASLILEKESDKIPTGVKLTITRMQTSAGKMQMLIDDLLSYTKIMNEETRFEEVDLNTVLQEVQIEMKESLKEKNAVILVSALPVVRGVSFQLCQLFINLISNSIKFAKADVPAIITISSSETAREHLPGHYTANSTAYHCITVADNGIGFNSAYRKDIFKVFHRLHTNQYKGTGIGLAICKKITESIGSFIEAESEEGEGATFTIYFPVGQSIILS